jgi:hypothetical protein
MVQGEVHAAILPVIMGDVAADLDLNLFPLYRLQGHAIPQIPGLLAWKPPKRAAHARKKDRLLVFLSLSGNTPFPSAEYTQVTNRIAQHFYQKSGSLTSAIRVAAEELNQSLLKRNLQTTGKSEHVAGRLILGVLRDTQLLIAQCGPTHVFHLSGAETQQIHDEEIAGHGLGTSQATPVYFAQVDLHAGDLLVLCPNLPKEWEAKLIAEKNTTADALRRKLVGTSSDDVKAVLVQVQAGKGNLNISKGLPSDVGKPTAEIPAAQPEASSGMGQDISTGIPGRDSVHGSSQAVPRISGLPSAMPTSKVQSGRPASRFAHLLSGGGQSTPPASPSGSEIRPQSGKTTAVPSMQPARPAPGQILHRPAAVPAQPATHPLRQSGHFVSARAAGDLPEIKRPASRHQRAIFGGLVKLIRGVRGSQQNISKGIKKFTPTILPNSNNDSEAAGPSMALFAIVIPVIIVAIAATVYIHYGRTAQYQQYYDMALAQAAQARGQANPTEVRRLWDSTIYYLDLAEKNQKTKDSTTLRQEAQTALDNLDGILRLDFRPAIIGGLSRSAQISHMAATDNDLYLLDASSGGVIHASLTDQGYQVDVFFKCAPGQYDTIIVDSLIDLAVLPMSNSYNASVLAMDGKGNLLYCGSAEPAAVSLIPPQLGWRGIAAFSLDSGGQNLYVLDPAGNAVWQYTRSDGKFQTPPTMFFGEQVPQSMNTTIDLAANDSDLYLLFRDGHVTSCPVAQYSSVAPMRCMDPEILLDTRPERTPGPKINDAIFTQMTFASAPDPSLYLLEPLTRAIYRFNPRSDSLELRGQFRATMEQNNTLFNGPATAMTISSNRYAFFSVGNQVYFATDVP